MPIGGQALIEGIMMRGPEKTVLAVRTPNGTIFKEEIEQKNYQIKYKIFKLPFLRGITSLIDSMSIGYKALSVSAKKAFTEEEIKEEETRVEKWIKGKFGDKTLNVITGLASGFGILLSIFIFIILPTYIFNISVVSYPKLYNSVVTRSAFEGILRIILFFIYLIFCSQLKDMQRVFKYHGAEHKAIFCYENSEVLNIDNVKKQKRFHPRCGTSFVVVMIVVGIIIGFFIPTINPFLRALIKIGCFPIIISLGYELIKICSKHDNILTKTVTAPGLWMQRITTKEPDDDMIAIAIEALKGVIPEGNEDEIYNKTS